MSERWPQFDAKRDNELIAAGTHFWCHACQVARLLAEKSLDERYCRPCRDLLKAEAALETRRKPWHPRGAVSSPVKDVKEVVTASVPIECVTTSRVTNSTQGVESAIDVKIAALDAAGLKGRDISAALAKEGIFLSYRTIYRRLQGSLT